jgi:hypothetical protein
MAGQWTIEDAPAAGKWVIEDAPKAAPGRSWSDVPLEAIKNTPASAGNFASGIYQAVRHPIDTGMNLWDAAAGGLHNILPKGLTDAIEINPEAAKRAVATADAVGGFYKDRYGSMEGLKNTLSTDPVGFAADLSTVFGGGAALAGKVPKLGGISDALSTAQRYTNPLNAVKPVIRGVAKVTGAVGKNVLGMTTGTGPESIAQAFQSGIDNKTSFFDNLTGKSTMTDVLDVAKQNIQNMGAKKSADYRSGMIDIRGDKSVLNFGNIDKAVQDGMGGVTFKGQIKNAKGAQVMNEIGAEISNWKKLNPADFHTPEGLDALKQKIGGIVESIPFEEKTARMVGNGIYNSIKNEITTQAPTYAKVMKGYAESSDNIKEIERALSLGNKAAADTAMRKLQSLTRNNVQTNYGNRLDLAKTLEQQGGNEIMPALAGQSMNSWTSRGLAGRAENLATLGGAAVMSNPWILGALPFQSPKAVGGALYGLGQASRPIKGLLDAGGKYNPLSPAQMQAMGLLSYQTGRLPQEEDMQYQRSR